MFGVHLGLELKPLQVLEIICSGFWWAVLVLSRGGGPAAEQSVSEAAAGAAVSCGAFPCQRGALLFPWSCCLGSGGAVQQRHVGSVPRSEWARGSGWCQGRSLDGIWRPKGSAKARSIFSTS